MTTDTAPTSEFPENIRHNDGITCHLTGSLFLSTIRDDPFFVLLQNYYPLTAISASLSGLKTLQPLCQAWSIPLWINEALAAKFKPLPPQVHSYPGSLHAHLERLWPTHHSLIFCLATGAVVRLIAPLLQDKSSDPAIVVVDPAGKFVISLCGGHQGGADQLTRLVAQQLGATPVLTGAANGLDLPGIDRLGQPFGWQRGGGDWTGVSAAIARQELVQVIQEVGSTLWQAHLPDDHPFRIVVGREITPEQPTAQVWISCSQHQFSTNSDLPNVQWHPRVLWVGIGCERGTSKALIARAVQQVCQAHHLAEAAIAGVATIDVKADEVGLVGFCQERHFPLRCFPAELLRTVAVPHPSAIVQAEVGTPSVAEAAAILASREAGIEQQQEESASQKTELLVSKQIVRVPEQPGAVTIAIAVAEREYIGQSGQLWLVGTGPGQVQQITPAAQNAITQADAVIGYSLYIDLIHPLLRPGQIVEPFPITQERQRAERAIELAMWGLTVAVISSGDCGIYGMAGLVLEQLQAQGWDGQVPAVQVFPGITAVQSAAALVGAPLMHDLCTISLSDLLTPWSVIETRLMAAAEADFVTALYNPRSRSRTEHIAIAQRIFLHYRHPDTPVAIVRSAYRPEQQVTVSTLAQLLTVEIDMLTTVLIGNRSTCTYANWMITPRGYTLTDHKLGL